MSEDTSIEDFGRDMHEWHASWRFRLLMLWWRVKNAWRPLACALRGHVPKPWGGKYWTDYGYEYDGGISCERCGEELT